MAAAQSRHVDVCDSNASLIGQWASVNFLSRKNMATLAGRIYSAMEKEFKQLSNSDCTAAVVVETALGYIRAYLDDVMHCPARRKSSRATEARMKWIV